jgi:hypothetical protein
MDLTLPSVTLLVAQAEKEGVCGPSRHVRASYGQGEHGPGCHTHTHSHSQLGFLLSLPRLPILMTALGPSDRERQRARTPEDSVLLLHTVGWRN